MVPSAPRAQRLPDDVRLADRRQATGNRRTCGPDRRHQRAQCSCVDLCESYGTGDRVRVGGYRHRHRRGHSHFPAASVVGICALRPFFCHQYPDRTTSHQASATSASMSALRARRGIRGERPPDPTEAIQMTVVGLVQGRSLVFVGRTTCEATYGLGGPSSLSEPSGTAGSSWRSVLVARRPVTDPARNENDHGSGHSWGSTDDVPIAVRLSVQSVLSVTGNQTTIGSRMPRYAAPAITVTGVHTPSILERPEPRGEFSGHGTGATSPANPTDQSEIATSSSHWRRDADSDRGVGVGTRGSRFPESPPPREPNPAVIMALRRSCEPASGSCQLRCRSWRDLRPGGRLDCCAVPNINPATTTRCSASARVNPTTSGTVTVFELKRALLIVASHRFGCRSSTAHHRCLHAARASVIGTSF